MCGIAGVLYADSNRSVSAELLTEMGNAIAHRGPDGEGTFRAGSVGLVHRRLAIIDLEGGRQPLSNEDESMGAERGQVSLICAFTDLRKGLATS